MNPEVQLFEYLWLHMLMQYGYNLTASIHAIFHIPAFPFYDQVQANMTLFWHCKTTVSRLLIRSTSAPLYANVEVPLFIYKAKYIINNTNGGYHLLKILLILVIRSFNTTINTNLSINTSSPFVLIYFTLPTHAPVLFRQQALQTVGIRFLEAYVEHGGDEVSVQVLSTFRVSGMDAHD